jgi:cytochrome c-type biogenesis protein CcmH
MTLFELASLAMALVALALFTRPWWHTTAPHGPNTMIDTLAMLCERIRRLDTLRDSGELGTEAHAAARAGLERQVVEHLLQSPSAAPQAARARLPRRTLAGLAAFITAVVVGGYLWVGDPAALGSRAVADLTQAPRPAADPAAHELGAEQIAAMTERLAARLQAQPDDADGWAMLARSYAVSGRHDKAVAAFRRAAALQQADAVLLADFADALAVTQQRRLAGEPIALVSQALAIDPKNLKALALAGTEAFDRQDYAAALKHWVALQQAAPADDALLQQVQGGIEQARLLAGPGPAAMATPPAGAGVSGTVTLSPALAAKAAPGDTLFVFARPASGSRMPLAILRKQVKDLPLRFTLDDSLAMSPAARLSSHAQVVVGARISKDGQATPQAGDLQGQSAVVALGSRGVAIEIAEAVTR